MVIKATKWTKSRPFVVLSDSWVQNLWNPWCYSTTSTTLTPPLIYLIGCTVFRHIYLKGIKRQKNRKVYFLSPVAYCAWNCVVQVLFLTFNMSFFTFSNVFPFYFWHLKHGPLFPFTKCIISPHGNSVLVVRCLYRAQNGKFQQKEHVW